MIEWTKEPPTEPGNYWWRRNIKHLKLVPRILTHRKHPILGWAWHYGVPIHPTVDGEWWPERIEAPDHDEQDTA